MRSIGSYSDSYGLDAVRRDIAAYINARDEAELADYLSSPQGTCTSCSLIHRVLRSLSLSFALLHRSLSLFLALLHRSLSLSLTLSPLLSYPILSFFSLSPSLAPFSLSLPSPLSFSRSLARPQPYKYLLLIYPVNIYCCPLCVQLTYVIY